MEMLKILKLDEAMKIHESFNMANNEEFDYAIWAYELIPILIRELKENLMKEKIYREDNINCPAHYTSGKIEVIDFIEDQRLGYNLGNAVKYISMAGKKDPDKTAEDLQKAAWYINREINRINGGE